MSWFAGQGSEPEWPVFPSETVRRQRGIRLFRENEKNDLSTEEFQSPEEYADHQAASLWLNSISVLVEAEIKPWMLEVVQTYSTWTASANGSGLELHERIDHPPMEWNNAYFTLLANCLPKLSLPEINQLVTALITSLPDQQFFDIITPFLRSVDAVYFNNRGLQEPTAVCIRSTLANCWDR